MAQLLMLAKEDKLDMIEQYTRSLMKAPENRLIKKTNMRSVHSKVHMGNNEWHTKHDKDIYPAFASNVASHLNDVLNASKDGHAPRRLLKEVEQFLDYMADKGYCNDDVIGTEMATAFRGLVQRLKAVIHDVTSVTYPERDIEGISQNIEAAPPI
jgi:hypothetical protein